MTLRDASHRRATHRIASQSNDFYMETEMDRPRFELSADTRLVAQRLRAVGIGETITYAALAAEIGRPVERSTLQSARRVLLRDHMIVFGAVHRVGLKRLDDDGIVSTSAETAASIRRKAERGVATLACVRDFTGLSTGQQLRHTAAAATLCAIAQMASEKQLAKVETRISPTTNEVPFRQTLSLFLEAKA